MIYDKNSSAKPNICSPTTYHQHKQHLRSTSSEQIIKLPFGKRLQTQISGICSPNGVGWYVKNDTLTIDQTDEAPAPEAVLEIVSCNCNTSKCETQRCSCVKNNLPCSDVCGCVNCLNAIEETSAGDYESDDEDDEDTDHYEDDSDDSVEEDDGEE